jgi:hypothetical protein
MLIVKIMGKIVLQKSDLLRFATVLKQESCGISSLNDADMNGRCQLRLMGKS